MSLLRNIASGLRSLFRKEQVSRELDEELNGFLEMAAEEKMKQGMNRKDAIRAVRLERGNLEVTKEVVRSAGWESFVETFWQDLRFAVRMLRKSPGFAMVVILTLALGIGANTAIFSLIDAAMLRTLHVDDPQTLFQVKLQNPRRPGAPGIAFTNPLWEQLRDQQDGFSNVFAWSEDRFDLAQGGEVHLVHGMWVSGNFFNTLGLRPTAGRLIAASDDNRGCAAVAVLSDAFWQEHYGAAKSAIGSNLSLSRHLFQVIGVAPSDFYSMDQGERFDVALPICAARIFDGDDSRLDSRVHSRSWLQVAGRAKPGLSQTLIIARLRALSSGILAAAVPLDWPAEPQRSFAMRTLTAVPVATGSSEFGLVRRFERPLDILMAVVALVMLIACANIASLMVARGAARHKEIAVRKALGASRMRLICQLLTECLLLSVAGALLGILFARWGTSLLVRYISTSNNAIFLELSPDGRVLAFTATVALLTAILFGLLPAVQSTRVALTSAMKGRQALEIERPSRFPSRKWIVASQLALSLVLLVAAGLMLRSFAKLAALDLGFDRNNVLIVGTDLQAVKLSQDQRLSTVEAIETRLRDLPGVVSVGRSMLSPLQGGMLIGAPITTDWSKGLTGDEAQTWFNYVSPGYFETLRTPLLDGRNFTVTDMKTDATVAVIDQTLARRFFPGLNPIGRTFRANQASAAPGPPIQVVGLVKDAKYQSVREQTHPTVFYPDAQPELENFELRTVIRPSALVLPVQAAVAGVNKEIPLEFGTLAQQVRDSLVRERLLALLSGFFGALALLLAMIGLYGTLSYLVSQRQGEFGIRMALGAQTSSIFVLVARDIVVILGGGVAVGVGISLATVQILQNLLFGLPAHDIVT